MNRTIWFRVQQKNFSECVVEHVRHRVVRSHVRTSDIVHLNFNLVAYLQHRGCLTHMYNLYIQPIHTHNFVQIWIYIVMHLCMYMYVCCHAYISCIRLRVGDRKLGSIWTQQITGVEDLTTCTLKHTYIHHVKASRLL